MYFLAYYILLQSVRIHIFLNTSQNLMFHKIFIRWGRTPVTVVPQNVAIAVVIVVVVVVVVVVVAVVVMVLNYYILSHVVVFMVIMEIKI